MDSLKAIAGNPPLTASDVSKDKLQPNPTPRHDESEQSVYLGDGAEGVKNPVMNDIDKIFSSVSNPANQSNVNRPHHSSSSAGRGPNYRDSDAPRSKRALFMYGLTCSTSTPTGAETTATPEW